MERRERLFRASRADADTLKDFESRFTRSYFHNQPLSKVQVDSWREYLDMEEARKPRDETRLRALFERALVVVNNYVEFWLRYAAVLEEGGNLEGACALLRTACASGRLRGRPDAIVALAELEEQCGRPQRARSLLELALSNRGGGGRLGRGSAELALRRASVELRAGSAEDAVAVLLRLLADATEPVAKALLSRRCAHLCEHALGRPDLARTAFEAAWREGLREPSLLADYAAFAQRQADNNMGDRLLESISIFEDALTPSSACAAGWSLSEVHSLWAAYVDFLVLHGAPLPQLRSAQARARRAWSSAGAAGAARSSSVQGVQGGSATKRGMAAAAMQREEGSSAKAARHGGGADEASKCQALALAGAAQHMSVACNTFAAHAQFMLGA